MVTIKEYLGQEYLLHRHHESTLYSAEKYDCEGWQARAQHLSDFMTLFQSVLRRATEEGLEIRDGKKHKTKLRTYQKILKEALPSSAISVDSITEKQLKATGVKGVVGECGLADAERGITKRVMGVFLNIFDRFINRAAMILNENPTLKDLDFQDDDYTFYRSKGEADLMHVIFKRIIDAHGGSERVSPVLPSLYSEINT